METSTAFLINHDISNLPLDQCHHSLLPSQTKTVLLPSSNRCSSRTQSTLVMSAVRYGPQEDMPPDMNISSNGGNRNELKSEFTSLLHTIINDTLPPEEYPSLFTQNIEMILNVLGNPEGGMLLEEIIREDVQNYNLSSNNSSGTDSNNAGDTQEEGSATRLDQVSEAVNMIISFVETFVEQTKSMDDVYKQLLGKIFQSIAPNTGKNNNNAELDNTSKSSSSMENQLDNLLSQEAEAFTPGFLRHVEGECDRIASLKTISPESTKMLQILRLIQTRVLEELGKGIGEGAIVLGQLLGYDNEAERLAVLDAGLAVRGVDFAHELVALTEEALEGFDAVPDGVDVDPELVRSVKAIDERIRVFIGKMDFQ